MDVREGVANLLVGAGIPKAPSEKTIYSFAILAPTYRQTNKQTNTCIYVRYLLSSVILGENNTNRDDEITSHKSLQLRRIVSSDVGEGTANLLNSMDIVVNIRKGGKQYEERNTVGTCIENGKSVPAMTLPYAPGKFRDIEADKCNIPSAALAGSPSCIDDGKQPCC